MEEIIVEGYIKGSKPAKKLKETNLKHMINYICKISGKFIGTGFFCKIEYEDDLTPVLITNYHVIDDDYIKNNTQLKIYIDNKLKLINLNQHRKIYSSRMNEYDIMIIKIKEEDKINNFFELEQNIFNDNPENIFKNETIYILHYPYGDEAMISYGCGIEKIDNYNIKHKCHTESGSSGGPIVNSLNNKVIGLHKAVIKKKGINEYNIGTFLKYPLYYIDISIIHKNDDNCMLFPLKYILAGDKDGRTAILSNFIYDMNVEGRSERINFYPIIFKKDKRKYKIIIWDIPERKMFKSIFEYHHNEALYAISVYMADDRSSFENAINWIEDFKRYPQKDINIILVGIICCEENRDISYVEGKLISDKYGIKFYEILNEKNIDEIFIDSIKATIKNLKEKAKKFEEIKNKRDEGKSNYIHPCNCIIS